MHSDESSSRTKSFPYCTTEASANSLGPGAEMMHCLMLLLQYNECHGLYMQQHADSHETQQASYKFSSDKQGKLNNPVNKGGDVWLITEPSPQTAAEMPTCLEPSRLQDKMENCVGWLRKR